MGYLRTLEPVGGRRRFAVLNPVDGAEVGQFDVCTREDVDTALARARSAQVGWAETPIKERVKRMQVALKLLLERQDAYIDTMISDTGRTRMETLFIEVFAACDSMNYYSRRAEKVLGDRRVGLHLLRLKKAKVVYRPLGVVGIITPWNGPFILSLNPTVQAVLAGNAVLIKPSEVTPLSAGLVEELFTDAGFPPGLVQVLHGDGETGQALIEAGVDKISFTGSVRTGRKVGEACGRNLIPCTLELGGKDPMVVCADADVERAAGGAVFGAMMNAGQFCSSTERVYVVRDVADAFTEQVVERVRRLEFGRDIGAVIFEPQTKIIRAHIEDAVAKGAKILCGGEPEGSYYQPTVLTEVTHDMDIMTEETFGPVLPIVVVDTEEDALRLANDTRFGLGASVWTRDKRRGEGLARRLDAGAVMINESSMAYGALEVPFGGWKESGVGQVNGADGLRRYCHAQPIITDRFGAKEEGVWYPYTADKVDGIQKAAKWLFGTPLRWLM